MYNQVIVWILFMVLVSWSLSIFASSIQYPLKVYYNLILHAKYLQNVFVSIVDCLQNAYVYQLSGMILSINSDKKDWICNWTIMILLFIHCLGKTKKFTWSKVTVKFIDIFVIQNKIKLLYQGYG